MIALLTALYGFYQILGKTKMKKQKTLFYGGESLYRLLLDGTSWYAFLSRTTYLRPFDNGSNIIYTSASPDVSVPSTMQPIGAFIAVETLQLELTSHYFRRCDTAISEKRVEAVSGFYCIYRCHAARNLCVG
jgi:hypothetical protein